MHIFLVTQYFWPESFIINDLVSELVDQGNQVTVLTGKPNYPDGQIFPGYSQEGLVEEVFDDRVKVLRVPLRPRGKGAIHLVLNYLSFVTSGVRNFSKLTCGLMPDVILVYAPSPVTAAIPAILLSRRKKVHLAFWVQDLWPESLAATGFVRNPLLLAAVGVMVRAIYSCCDTLLIQSRAFAGPVMRYADKSKIFYYPNSMVDIAHGKTEKTDGKVPVALLDLLDSSFCAVFAGNIGNAQAVETLLDSASLLQDLPDFRLVLVGSGSRLDWVRSECDRRKLTNVVLAGRFPSEVMPSIFSRADALLVTLRREIIFSYTVPSKVQAYLAAGRPLVAALDGEGARIIKEAGAGLCCPAEDAKGLAERLRELYAMPVYEREEMGLAGRRYFLEHFEMNKLARKLTDLLRARVEGK